MEKNIFFIQNALENSKAKFQPISSRFQWKIIKIPIDVNYYQINNFRLKFRFFLFSFFKKKKSWLSLFLSQKIMKKRALLFSTINIHTYQTIFARYCPLVFKLLRLTFWKNIRVFNGHEYITEPLSAIATFVVEEGVGCM